jgi:tRNA modification GTPase
VAESVFKSKNGRLLSDLRGYSALLGCVETSDGSPVDETVALVFRAPKSYTGEDVVELYCHGGLFVTKQVLNAVFKAGASPAEAGEFTKRAFLNGKMDLASAESVMNIISSHSEQETRAAYNALEGALSRKIAAINAKLIAASATLQAWVDYPDDEIEELSDGELLKSLEAAATELEELISRFDSGKAVIGGVRTAIVGKPNVGKSTLMNLLLGEERSIVTSVEGTTRDIVEETAVIGCVALRLADTAGLRASEDEVEKIGVDRAKKWLDSADFVLAVFDLSRPLTDEDDGIFSLVKSKKSLAVLNKTDLETRADKASIIQNFSDYIEISAKSDCDYPKLCEKIEKVLEVADFDPSVATLVNARQRSCCENALKDIKDAVSALENGVTLDAVNVTVDSAIDRLLVLTGEKASDAVINEIFSRFCVGK